MKSGECGPYLRSGRIPPIKHEDHCSTDKVKCHLHSFIYKTEKRLLIYGVGFWQKENEFDCIVNQVRLD